MPLIPYQPFGDEEGLEPLEGPRFRFPMIKTPKMDIYETNSEVVAEIELPGADLKNIKIEVKNNILGVEAKKEEKKEEKGKGYYRKEISAGYYKRAVSLPVEVLGEKAEATYKEGILKIVIPKVKPTKKKEEKKPIKINIKGSKTV